MPTTLAEPLSRVSTAGNSFLGDYPANDILFLRCRLCGLTYGSQHSVRKHFAKTHGREPTADCVSVQSISATKRAMSERAANGTDKKKNGVVDPPTSKPPARYIDPNNYVSEYAIEYGGTDAIAAAMAMTAKISKGKLAVRSSTAANGKLKQSRGANVARDGEASSPVKEELTADSDNEKSMMRCLQCGKDFPTRDWGVFRRHVRAHDTPAAGSAAYRCTVCPAAFSDAATRRAHMSTSHRLTTCSCRVCDIGFTHIGALRKHLRTAHAAASISSADVEYRCLYCPRSFCAHSDLEAHTNRHEYADAECANLETAASSSSSFNAAANSASSKFSTPNGHSTKTLLNTDDPPTSSSFRVDKAQLAKIRQSPPPDSACNDIGLLKKHLLAETTNKTLPSSSEQTKANACLPSNASMKAIASSSSTPVKMKATSSSPMKVKATSSSSSTMTVKLDESGELTKGNDDKCKNLRIGRNPENVREIIDSLVKDELTGSMQNSSSSKPRVGIKEKTEEEIKIEKKLEARRKTDLWFIKLSRDRKSCELNGIHKPLDKGVFMANIASKASSNTVSKDAKIVCDVKPIKTSHMTNNDKKILQFTAEGCDEDMPSTSFKNKMSFRDMHTTLCTDHACENNYLRTDEQPHNHHHHHEGVVEGERGADADVVSNVPLVNFAEIANEVKPKYKAFDLTSALQCAADGASGSKFNFNIAADKTYIPEVVDHLVRKRGNNMRFASTMHQDVGRQGIPAACEETNSDSN